jgi:hypothetical protein
VRLVADRPAAPVAPPSVERPVAPPPVSAAALVGSPGAGPPSWLALAALLLAVLLAAAAATARAGERGGAALVVRLERLHTYLVVAAIELAFVGAVLWVMAR